MPSKYGVDPAGAGVVFSDPFDSRPPASNPFDVIFSADVAPGATVTLADVTMDPNEFVRVYGLAQEIASNAIQGFLDCIWSLTLDGRPDVNYGRLRDQVGAIVSPGNIDVRYQASGRLRLTVTNTSAVNTYRCAGRLVGYAFPASEWDRYLRGRGDRQ